MKRVITIFMIAKIWAIAATAAKAEMSPELSQMVERAKPTDLIPVNIVLKEQMDPTLLNSMVQGLPRKVRQVRVAQILQEFSRAKQEPLLNYLRDKEKTGQVKRITPLWLSNVVHCEATVSVIQELLTRSDLWFIDNDHKYFPADELLEKPLRSAAPADEITRGVRMIRAPEVWALGYRGQGIIVSVIDTGVDYNHPDLADHMWTSSAYPNHGYNFQWYRVGQDSLDPMDEWGHGTHVAGTVASDGTAGTQCGVAPEAQVMALEIYPWQDTIGEHTVWRAMEFSVSPPRDPTNGADLISMSLGWFQFDFNPRMTLWRINCTNVGIAGLVMIVAAGNERHRSPPYSLRVPGCVPPPWRHPQNGATGGLSSVVSIGATDTLDNIAYFSSRGPSTWQTIPPDSDYVYPPGLTDPDVAAPGVDIKSCARGGGYTYMSGTSMATPHTSGTVALMLSKNPTLTPAQIDSILEMTAYDLGPAGKDNDFGSGRIDALAAVNYTRLPSGVRYYRHIIDDALGNNDGIVNPGEAINLPLWVLNLQTYTVSGVWAKLRQRVPDTLFSITDSVKRIGEILPNDSGYTGADGFNFTVSPNATDRYNLAFTLVCKDTLDSTWYSDINILVGAPVLNFVRFTVYDSPPGGNNNGVLDPNEAAQLTISLKNAGLGNGYNVSGVLKMGDARVLVSDSLGGWGTLLRDSTKENNLDRFTVSAGLMPAGTLVPCTLKLSADGYSVRREFSIRVGTPPQPPGTIIWGPKAAPGTPSTYGLYGLTYKPTNNRIYVCYYFGRLIYVYSADSMLTYLGTIPTPNNETACTDIKYCAYDNTFWVHSGQSDRVYKIDSTGNVLRYFPTPAVDYPTGLAWDETEAKLYLVDRRAEGVNPNYIYITDTLGTVIKRIDIPFVSRAGARCLALDWTNSNPLRPSLIMLYTWFSATALDSIGVYELHRDTFIVNQYFRIADVTNRNARGVEYDPRDASYWISIMQGSPRNNMIMKVTGFHLPTGIEENSKVKIQKSKFSIAPNPFSDRVRISYQVTKPGPVVLKIYDITGKEVVTLQNQKQTEGSYEIYWNGRDRVQRRVARGVYFYRLKTADGDITGKALLVR